MGHEELLRRIEERLRIKGLTERRALLDANIGVDFVRDIRRRGHSPKLDKLAALARILETPLGYFTEATDAAPSATAIPLTQVAVRGEVQAGVWREAVEWSEEDRFFVTVPTDARYPGMPRFGLLVRGNSMNKLYPEGTIVMVIRLNDLAREPKPGERVVVLRRDQTTGEFEATLKEYDIDAQGRRLLWPRSYDPEFQVPIILAGPALTPLNANTVPSVAHAGTLHDAGEPDVIVTAVVVGSYRPE